MTDLLPMVWEIVVNIYIINFIKSIYTRKIREL